MTQKRSYERCDIDVYGKAWILRFTRYDRRSTIRPPYADFIILDHVTVFHDTDAADLKIVYNQANGRKHFRQVMLLLALSKRKCRAR